jgi:hypothetical protein
MSTSNCKQELFELITIQVLCERISILSNRRNSRQGYTHFVQLLSTAPTLCNQLISGLWLYSLNVPA